MTVYIDTDEIDDVLEKTGLSFFDVITGPLSLGAEYYFDGEESLSVKNLSKVLKDFEDTLREDLILFAVEKVFPMTDVLSAFEKATKTLSSYQWIQSVAPKNSPLAFFDDETWELPKIHSFFEQLRLVLLEDTKTLLTKRPKMTM